MGKLDRESASNEIIEVVRDNFTNNTKLDDSEKTFFIEAESKLEESSSKLVKIFALASALAIPSLIPTQALAKELATIPAKQLHFNNKKVNDAMQKAAIEKQKFGNLSFVNMTNLLATIIYNEAMLDYVKTGDDNCLIAIANVIDNRAGGDASKYASVISAKS